MPMREWQQCRFICCGGCQEWSNWGTYVHVPRKISSVCSFFLQRNGVINISTTETRRFSADLPQRGLEILYLIIFKGPGKEVQKVRKLVTAALLTTPAKSFTDEVQPNKRMKVEEDSVEGHDSSEA